MAKTSGLGAAISVADASSSAQTISNDITDFTLSTPRAVQDITGVDKSAHERLLLLADASVSFKGVFNNGADMSHEVFSSVPSTSVERAVVISPTSTLKPDITMNLLFSDYAVARAAGGELTWTATGALADGTVPTWVNS